MKIITKYNRKSPNQYLPAHWHGILINYAIRAAKTLNHVKSMVCKFWERERYTSP